MKLTHLFFIAFIACTCLSASAQRTAGDRADKLFDKFNFAEALDEYLFQLGKDSTNVHLNRQIGLCLRKLGLIEQSTSWFDRVIDLSDATASDKLYYAEALRASGEYDQAVFWYRRYSSENPTDRRAQRHLSNPMYYVNLLADSLRYDLKHLDINTERPSFGMTPFNDRFIFSSAGVSNFDGNTHGHSELAFLDLYACDLDLNGEFVNVEPLTGAVNSKYHDGPACFDSSSQTLLVTRNNMKGGKPVYDKSGTANLKVYSYQLTNGKWSEAPDLPFNSDDYSAGHPAVSPDGTFIVFVSNMQGGYGGTDLYISFRNDTGWSEPSNLGGAINTEGNEMFPFISATGKLYFASDGHAGLGGLDLFSAEPRSDKNGYQFDEPVNLGAPINSASDDFSLYYNEVDEWGYFSSNRGGLGRDNLFRFKRKQFSHQIFAASLSAREHVSMSSRMVRLHNHRTLADSSLRLDETGSFRALVSAGESYSVYLGTDEQPVMSFKVDDKLLETYRFGGVHIIEKDQLLSAGLIKERSLAMPMIDFTATTGSGILERLEKLRDSAKLLSDAEFDALSTSGLIDDSELDALVAQSGEEAMALNQSLVEQRLNNLNFGFDSYGIRSAERAKINALVDLLNENTDARIVIKAHTDSRGDENYNLLLSMRRAKSIQKALADKGIDQERIKIAWVGSSELLIDCGTQRCSQADHALNRRAEVVALSNGHRADRADE